jgi:molecular chaperone DnaK
MTPEGPIHLDENLTRAQFEQMTKSLLDRTKAPFHKVIEDAGIKVADIDHVVLVGGSTRMPAVSNLVMEMTGGKEHNKSLGTFELTGIAPAPRGVPKIEVTFDIDANGIVNVSAKDQGTGKEQKMTITGGSALSKDEIDRMVKDAEAHADEDKKRREEAEVKNQAEQLVFSTENFLKESGDKIPADVKTPVEESLADLKAAIAEGSEASADDIKAKVEDLNTKSQAMGQAVYASEQAGAGAAGSADAQDGSHAGASAGASAGADDDVVDAEVVDDDEAKEAK